MSVPKEDVYLETCTAVLEQLRELEPTERRAIVDDLYSRLAADGRPFRLPGSKTRVYACWLGGYAFFYRELTRKELARAGEDFGYVVTGMKSGAQWIMRQLGG
jgi:hypothetical protein